MTIEWEWEWMNETERERKCDSNYDTKSRSHGEYKWVRGIKKSSAPDTAGETGKRNIRYFYWRTWVLIEYVRDLLKFVCIQHSG